MEPVAVVGIGAVFPQAGSPEEFWRNIVQGVDTTREVPAGRWVMDPNQAHSPGTQDRVVSRRGCFIDRIDVPAESLQLDAALLRQLDPSCQLALAASCQAFGDDATERGKVGVVLASIALPTEGSSQLTRDMFGPVLCTAAEPPPAPSLRSRVVSLPAAIVARGLGLGGSSYTLDAACASSLFAVKLACDELREGRADAMLAGGVCRADSLYTQMGFTALQALSPSGRCSPFDAAADGLLVGEGAGVVLLKRLSDARAQGNRIYAVISAVGLSNDVGGSLLAPDSEGQLRAMRQAYREAGWQPSDVDLIECHGTGTPTGDRMELRSLQDLWGSADWRIGQCAIGSVKSMIGHTLTAAGAAGLIKVLLGLRHETLPPSANFQEPPRDTPLQQTPFRVQTRPEPWTRRPSGGPRRAAVSAFGFGGINAHLLLSEHVDALPAEPRTAPADAPIAIVGMACQFGNVENLTALQHLIFQGGSAVGPRPARRWHGADDVLRQALGGQEPRGAFLGEAALASGQYRIPPNDIPGLLPQQLLMLEVAAQAVADAGLERRQMHRNAGAIVGVSLDFDTTNFQMRWAMPALAARWAQALGVPADAVPDWVEALRESASPALDANRTLGALASIAASRVARELSLGGPSFSISAEEASGLRALEVAARLLRRGELDWALAAAVDLAGDGRLVASYDPLLHYSRQDDARPFDRDALGPLVGEGAVALVLKRLADAEAAGDRVYAVVRGLGAASGGGVDVAAPSAQAYGEALRRAYRDAGVEPRTVSYVEAHGSGNAAQDRVEAAALLEFFGDGEEPCAVGSLVPTVGLAGAASGLGSVVKAALCLHHQILPPLRGFAEPPADVRWRGSRLHLPIAPSFWLRNRTQGPRRAGVSSMTVDGNCVHVVLEGVEPATGDAQPLGPRSAALFAVSGDDEKALEAGLDALRAHMTEWDGSLDRAARAWLDRGWDGSRGARAVALVAANASQMRQQIEEARDMVRGNRTAAAAVFYRRTPLGPSQVAFVFPGSGNHYVGMGRALGVEWPQVLRALDAETECLASHLVPSRYVPYRSSWPRGWQEEALRDIAADPHCMIFGQVAHGIVVSDLARHLGIEPTAVIGYSLGESAGLFALRAWPQRDAMYRRMLASPLFVSQLAGECTAARQAFGTDRWEWSVAVLNRPADAVRAVLEPSLQAFLLIVNTDSECVVGGERRALDEVVRRLGCEAIPLQGVVTVHCRAVEPVAREYRDLHLFDIQPPPGVRFYSGHWARAYDLSRDSAADSILAQALHGLDFRATIEQAYADGIRTFLEMGPQASCTRMIRKILGDRPHLAASLCVAGEDDATTVLRAMAALVAERVPLELRRLYPAEPPASMPEGNMVRVPIGRVMRPVKPPNAVSFADETDLRAHNSSGVWQRDMETAVLQTAQATAAAHEAFLRNSEEATRALGRGVQLQTMLLAQMLSGAPQSAVSVAPAPAFARDMCLEFARGSIAAVLGPEFAEVDRNPTRVRLPDEPLMLVDRIMQVEGVPRSLGGGRVVTEHDVWPDAWYLDGGRAPVFVSVEAGQADLFLSAYLGIDLETRGERVYRLLDATVRFHRDLPRPGEVIAYDIRIDRFVRQGDVHLFFFQFDGTIDGRPLLTMRDGCAGFFTSQEIADSRGIVLTEEETAPQPGKRAADWVDLVAWDGVETYGDDQVAALRAGDLEGCFGKRFAGLGLREPLRLPSGRLKLFDRVSFLDPRGGRWGLGRIRAEADVHPDDWFLTCHFVDDMVMPGTLMYECCAHTLRFFLLRMGWVGESEGTSYQPLLETPAVLRCRGPVTVHTRRVTYEVDIKEIGYGPGGEPYVLADALMFADGKRIVRFVDMSMRMVGQTRQKIESVWRSKDRVLYDKESILQFAIGRPSLAFGEPYKVYDSERRCARLPGPPYQFLDRITEVGQPPYIHQPGGWTEAHYDVEPHAWYFRANRQPTMPFAVLLEAALQPCGWLAAYVGSALKSPVDLHFRNLGGEAILYEELLPDSGTVTTRVRLTNTSEAGGMIVQAYDMHVTCGGRKIYEGTTSFGFFSGEALANQLGVRDAAARAYVPTDAEMARALRFPLERVAPHTPQDCTVPDGPRAALPAQAFLMMDEVEAFVPENGGRRLGYIRGGKAVDVEEWFFKAHFYQDPVVPGSLGLEAFLQLLKAVALHRWPHLRETHRFECIRLGVPHTWIYRGQIVQKNRHVQVEACVSALHEEPVPTVVADGFLKVDGLYIYEMRDFGLRLIPV